MSRRRNVARTVTSVATASVLSVALCAGSATPAQAGLLGGLLGTVGGWSARVTTLVAGTTQSLLGPTGWIVDEGVTDLDHVAAVIGADRMYSRGVTGKGVGVALVDTGVVPVRGLTVRQRRQRPGPVVREPVRSQRHLDTFGHGTHMAGIIAGNDPSTLLDSGEFQGIAPGARLTSLKVAHAPRAPSTSRRSSPPSTGSWRTATTTRRTRSGCSTCPTARTACRTTGSTR